MVVSCHIDTRNIDTLSLSIVTLTRLYDHADHPDNPTGEMVVSFVIWDPRYNDSNRLNEAIPTT